MDDGGAFSPLGTTLFWALQGWRSDRARLRQNLAFASTYVDYVRILCEVGWQDKSSDGTPFIDPEWPEYEQILGELIDCCYDEYGMRVELTVIGAGSGRDYLAAARRVVNVIRGREHKIMHNEGSNEPYNNLVDDPTARALGGILVPTGVLTALGSPLDGNPDAITALMSGTGAQVATAHLSRDNSPPTGGWRQVKQAWDLRDLPYLISQNEPPGPASSGGQNVDPLQLAMMRAHGALCGIGAYVLHCGAGVTGQIDVARGRPANIFEVPNAEAIFAAVRNVEKLIPKGVENWKRYNTWWQGNPLLADVVWTDGGDGHGVIQLQTAVNAQGQFVSMPIGIQQYVSVKAINACVVDIGDPTTGEIVRAALTLVAGESFTLKGPEQNGLGAYILLGNGAR